MAKLSVRDLDLAGKRVFMRVDFNVPQDKKTGEITNTARIAAALPTIQFILEKGGSGGQGGENLTPQRVADKLSELLGKPVKFLSDCVGAEVEAAAAALQPG